MTPDYRAMCAELVDALDSGISAGRIRMSPLVDRARALLAESVAEGPTDDELMDTARAADLAYYMGKDCGFASPYQEGTDITAEVLAFARAVLSRWGRPTPQPVAVSERLPRPEDCDEQGRCWLGGRQMGRGTPTWLLGYPAWAERFPDVHRFWLPANALPTPEATND